MVISGDNKKRAAIQRSINQRKIKIDKCLKLGVIVYHWDISRAIQYLWNILSVIKIW